jgi:glycosyltransferase involved in cell wall biosynthesis
MPADLLLLSVGAMTRNKGLVPLLRALADGEPPQTAASPRVLLLLKGIGDLYESRLWLESYRADVLQLDPPPAGEARRAFDAAVTRVFTNQVMFMDDTIAAAELCELYNAADLYAGGYIAEGFGLTLLEALRAGLPVMAPRGGGAADFLQSLAADGDGSQFIHFLPSSEVTSSDGMQTNDVRWRDVAQAVAAAVARKRAAFRGRDVRPDAASAARLAARIDAHWSWGAAATRLVALFHELCEPPRTRHDEM